MKITRRTDINTLPFFDVRFISEKLKGKYDNIYLILTTLEYEPTDAWQDQGDSFLLINLPKERVINATVDYRDEIIRNLSRLSWLEPEVLQDYVKQRWH